MSIETIAQASAAQIRAAQPDVSSWVGANAGSGKTRVLTNRVSRLLLRGTDPAKILCLTFTKAAAAEMQNRLFKQLGAWAMLPDAELQSALRDLGEAAPTGKNLDAARTLFARALETPGGLKIQTIHAFCESLLHRFPLEARISPEFQVMDDRQSDALRADVLDIIAQDHQDMFDRFVTVQSGDPFDFLPDILKHQEKFEHGFDAPAMLDVLAVEPDINAETMLARVMSGFSDLEISGLAKALVHGANKHQVEVAKILSLLDEIPAKAALLLLEAAFLTSGKPRSTGTFPVKAAKQMFAPALDIVTTLIERVAAARQTRLTQAVFEKTQALHDFAHEFLVEYNTQKANLGQLEFEDLIRKTCALLRNSDMAQWVLYRLDGGIDHILVDEAQDTSPRQWQIVSALAEEIYAVADETQPRSVFVVGDEKQSIFSFQGADPREFSRMRALFDQQLSARGTALAQGQLLHSFRSAAPILQLVDSVFEGEAAAGLSDKITHLATDQTRPGRVEIWPLLETPEKADKKKWFEPIDALPPGDPHAELARDIAARIAGLIGSGHELPGQNRAVQPGDFLILVQSRSTIFHALIKALKALSVPVAGADRLKVAEELAVKDLLAVLKFAATPQDDLSLACALRSPLCGVSESQLYQMAQGRVGGLWSQVRGQDMLSDILSRADFDRPFELLERILIRHKGRQNLLARLGPEAEDGIDELLRQALAFETTNIPSLTGFLEWISSDDMEVKRRMDGGSDQVRVMTIHGAKGLEAPIVVLPQTVKKANNTVAKVLTLAGKATIGTSAQDAPDMLLASIDENKRLQLEEKNRLLYVALTRAESWLIIAGAGDPKKADKDWFGMISAAALRLNAQKDSKGRLIFQSNWSEKCHDKKTRSISHVTSPAWLTNPAKAPVKPAKPRSPSELGGAHTVASAHEDRSSLERGSQIHVLLENLVTIPKDNRAAMAQSLLSAPALAGVIDEALNVLDATDLQEIFGPNTLREVAVSAHIAGIGPVFGRIDALIVSDTITAIDFKSNAKIPQKASDIPEAFLRQMGAYRAALVQIWPDKPVRTAICWTCNAELMDIPENLCAAALERAAEP